MASKKERDLKILCDYFGLEPEDFTYEYGKYWANKSNNSYKRSVNEGNNFFVLDSKRDLIDEAVERELNIFIDYCYSL